ncbi:TRAP transporter large permease subunit [Dehalococcoidia bacterium]|nr:TRAP transporter large permease subunit [Dehalococcoidia bacterium]
MELFWILAVIGGLLFLLLGGGVWIAIALALTGTVSLLIFTDVPAGILLATAAWTTNNSWVLSALPLFILMGELLQQTRVSEQLFTALAPWVNRLPGRLLHVNVLACTIFAAVSGSSAVTTATVGKVTLPEFARLNYDRSLTLGSLAASGTLGFLIPPSMMMIVYGVLAEVSIGKLFLAGVLPGLLIAGLFMSYIIIIRELFRAGKTSSSGTIEYRYSWKERITSLPQILPVIFLIFMILGSIYMGWATPTEAAALGVVGAMLIAIVSRTLSWRTFTRSLMGTVRTTCMVCFIVTGAAFLSVVAGFLGIPTQLAEIVAGWGLSPYMLLVVLGLFYVVLGAFFDGFSMIIMTIPITLPMAIAAGFDPLWFGIFLVLMVGLAQITPPVGFNLFVVQGLTRHEIGYIAKAAFPFFLLKVLAGVIFTAFPQIVMWLPGIMIGR